MNVNIWVDVNQIFNFNLFIYASCEVFVDALDNCGVCEVCADFVDFFAVSNIAFFFACTGTFNFDN